MHILQHSSGVSNDTNTTFDAGISRGKLEQTNSDVKKQCCASLIHAYSRKIVMYIRREQKNINQPSHSQKFPISRPHGQTLVCLLWVFENWSCHDVTPFCIVHLIWITYFWCCIRRHHPFNCLAKSYEITVDATWAKRNNYVCCRDVIIDDSQVKCDVSSFANFRWVCVAMIHLLSFTRGECANRNLLCSILML